MAMHEVQVRRSAFGETRVVEKPLPIPGEGQVLVRIDRFAITANNVTYAVAGDMIGYWKFFPAEGPYGIVPVWGFGEVIAARNADVAVGERLWGYWPMASHAVLQPGAVTARTFMDETPHRAGLPAVYNTYQRVTGEPAEMAALEEARCIYVPLFSTSYLLYDYLVDNGFFGASQIAVASASSKTGLGLLKLLSAHGNDRPRIIALTSPGNVAFVQSLAAADEARSYDEIASLDAGKPTAFVDMAGNGAVVGAIHQHFGANLKLSCAVGVTHWGAPRHAPSAGGAAHEFFFAPSQFEKRDREWGAGEIRRRAQKASLEMAAELKDAIRIRRVFGAEATAAAFADAVANRISPETGVIARVAD